MADIQQQQSGSLSQTGTSQQQQSKQQNRPPSTELGKEHELLRKTCGKFKAECTFKYEDGKESVYEGEAYRDMILGGRFLHEKFLGNFGGKQFEGHMLIGCTDGEFEVTWADTTSNQIYVSWGRFLEGSSCEFEVVSRDPFREDMTGRLKKTRQRNCVMSENEIVFESFDQYIDEGEKDQRTMKIVYRRMDQQPQS